MAKSEDPFDAINQVYQLALDLDKRLKALEARLKKVERTLDSIATKGGR